jgi:hypothetical protein
MGALILCQVILVAECGARHLTQCRAGSHLPAAIRFVFVRHSVVYSGLSCRGIRSSTPSGIDLVPPLPYMLLGRRLFALLRSLVGAERDDGHEKRGSNRDYPHRSLFTSEKLKCPNGEKRYGPEVVPLRVVVVFHRFRPSPCSGKEYRERVNSEKILFLRQAPT